MPAPRLLECQIDIASGRETRDRKAVGKSLDDFQSALADGAGRAEDGDTRFMYGPCLSVSQVMQFMRKQYAHRILRRKK